MLYCIGNSIRGIGLYNSVSGECVYYSRNRVLNMLLSGIDIYNIYSPDGMVLHMRTILADMVNIFSTGLFVCTDSFLAKISTDGVDYYINGILFCLSCDYNNSVVDVRLGKKLLYTCDSVDMKPYLLPHTYGVKVMKYGIELIDIPYKTLLDNIEYARSYSENAFRRSMVLGGRLL